MTHQVSGRRCICCSIIRKTITMKIFPNCKVPSLTSHQTHRNKVVIQQHVKNLGLMKNEKKTRTVTSTEHCKSLRWAMLSQYNWARAYLLSTCVYYFSTILSDWFKVLYKVVFLLTLHFQITSPNSCVAL